MSVSENVNKNDDERARSEFSTPEHKKQNLFRNFSPQLAAWANTRILKRAGAVQSKGAYLRASQEDFASNLDEEVREYLCEKAGQYFTKRFEQLRSTGEPVSVLTGDVIQHLELERQKHDLPVNRDIIITCVRAASERLGLTETPAETPAEKEKNQDEDTAKREQDLRNELRSLEKEIEEMKTGPDAHYDQTRDQIKARRRRAGKLRSALRGLAAAKG